jgi:hypothetical protein
MGILDNLEAYLDLDQLDNAWDAHHCDDSDLELQIQNPHISS